MCSLVSHPNPDPNDAAHYVAWVAQAGLGLPDRDYYTNTGAAADSIRAHYLRHVAATLALAGESPTAAAADARRVMSIEMALARASMTRVALRVPSATNHPTSIARLRALAPAVDWTRYFHSVGLTAPVARVNVAEPVFLGRASALVASVPLAEWRAYLRYHTLARASRWLSTSFVREDFAFRSRFTGATAAPATLEAVPARDRSRSR